MKKNWDKTYDLSQGTEYIKTKTTIYLPKEEKEEDKSYSSRLSKAVLFNVFNKTVDSLSGIAFLKNPKLNEDVPAQIKAIEDSVDLDGNHFDVFAKKLFDNGIRDGLHYAYVEMPKVEGEIKNKADEQRLNRRPYWVLVNARNVLNWRFRRIGGEDVLVQITIEETVSEPVGAFGEIQITQYRVLTPGQWTIYRQNEKGEAYLYDSGLTGIDVIPLVELNLDTNAPKMEALPPLIELCEMNIAHYQIYSDTRHSAHIASVPIFTAIGVDKKNFKSLTIGVNRAIVEENPQAKLGWTSYDGNGVNLNRDLMADLEQRMSIMGLSVLAEKQTDVTATEKLLDKTEEISQMAGWVRALKDALEQLLDYTALYYGLPDGGTVTVNSDIFKKTLSVEQMRVLSDMVGKGQLSNDTLWDMMITGEWLAEDFDKDEEASNLQSEFLPITPTAEPNE
jgi:hypothetical protein